ncbi:MAG: BrnA antitoxin family protein [Candidatus Binatia bacterium]
MRKVKRPAPKPIPHFASEDEEREFWATHDVIDYFDWSRAVEPSFPKLKPSTTAISLRLPITMLEELKSLANARDVPYQSLLKVFLADRLAKEVASRRRPGAGSRVAERPKRGYRGE